MIGEEAQVLDTNRSGVLICAGKETPLVSASMGQDYLDRVSHSLSDRLTYTQPMWVFTLWPPHL